MCWLLDCLYYILFLRILGITQKVIALKATTIDRQNSSATSIMCVSLTKIKFYLKKRKKK